MAEDDRRELPDRRRVPRGGRRNSDKLACPVCGYRRSEVIKPRAHPNGRVIRRRRRCLNCSLPFSTIEIIVGPDGKAERNI